MMKGVFTMTDRKKCLIKKRLEKREELLAEIKRLEEEVKEHEAYVKRAMEEDKITEGVFGDFKVGWKEIISNRFDSTAFKKVHNELYESFKRASSSMRFTVYKGSNS